MADDSALLIYGAPLAGVLLLSIGLAAGVMGGYSVVQGELDLCGDPSIHVASEAASDPYTGADAPTIPRIPVENLTAAERAAFEEGLDSPGRLGYVRGEAAHLDAFRGGVLVTGQDGPRYVTLSSMNRCVDANPLLFPLGAVSILVGIAGILTPPLYRRLEAFESGP